MFQTRVSVSVILTRDLSIFLTAYNCENAALSMFFQKAVPGAICHFKAAIDRHFLAVFLYDYLITFDSEVMLFWMPCKINGASILFLLNRYLTLAVQSHSQP